MNFTKPVFKKRPINKYLTPIDPDIVGLKPNQIICIDKAGYFFTMSLVNVRLLNGSYWNDNPEHFGEKLTFIHDFISVSVNEMGDVWIDISNNIKPTDQQLDILFALLKKHHKRYEGIEFSASWRWYGGGGCSIYSCCKRPGLLEKKVRAAIAENVFKGFANLWYEVEDE